MEKMASFGANGGMTDGYLAEAAIARAARGVVVIQEVGARRPHQGRHRAVRALFMALNVAQAEKDLRTLAFFNAHL